MCMAEGNGVQVEGSKGGGNWDICNSIVKIYLKNKHNHLPGDSSRITGISVSQNPVEINFSSPLISVVLLSMVLVTCGLLQSKNTNGKVEK